MIDKMTDKEALTILTSNRPTIARGNGKTLYRNLYIEAMNKAMEALQKADEYRWHDLRKNPDDLPNEGEIVLVQYLFNDGLCKENEPGEPMYRTGWGAGKWVCAPLNIIAWKYIEPFGGEQEL